VVQKERPVSLGKKKSRGIGMKEKKGTGREGFYLDNRR